MATIFVIGKNNRSERWSAIGLTKSFLFFLVDFNSVQADYFLISVYFKKPFSIFFKIVSINLWKIVSNLTTVDDFVHQGVRKDQC